MAGIWGLGLVGIKIWGSVDTVWGFRAGRGLEAGLVPEIAMTNSDSCVLFH
jgi:hypothetical protein